MKELLLILVIIILFGIIIKSKENMECSNYTNFEDCEKTIVANTLKKCSWDGEQNICMDYNIN